MKKEKWLIAAAAGAGAAAIIYGLSKRDIPKGATAVKPFDRNRYFGKWYEIARMPSRIEKNIRSLTEEYTIREDGFIGVTTKAYNYKKDKWIEATGRMKFAGSENEGMLKVSYFGPFFAAYNILDLDPDYRYTLVSGSGLDYLWILSRETTVPDDIKERFLKRAGEIGFDINKLEWDVV